jgi:hypothetical protein
VIRRGLDLLMTIHRSLALEQEGDKSVETPTLYEPRIRRTMYGLFDLVSLEGIYPLLSPGVGIPLERRVKSVLPVGVIARQALPSNNEDRSVVLLQEVVDCLEGICLNKRTGLGPICQERVLVDLISACGELAFGPNVEDGVTMAKYANIFKTLVGEYVSHSSFLFVLSMAQESPETMKEILLFPDHPSAESFFSC